MVDLSEFKVSNYPDGHKHIVSDKDLHGDTRLSASFRTFDDLFLAAQVKRIHPELTSLYIKYMLAGRCDRRFSPGEAIDLEIVCDFINYMGFEQISVLKPHSAYTLECLRKGRHYNSVHESDVTRRLIDMAERDIGSTEICFVSPDAGASQWINELRLEHYIQGTKTRDDNGVVVGVNFLRRRQKLFSEQFDMIDELNRAIVEKQRTKFVIVDDLCDGGGTFTAIAKAIKQVAPAAKVYLVVTHAIFSKGFKPFMGLIDRIYCTDSYETFDYPLVTQLKI